MFDRYSRKTGNDPSSDHELDGIIRRGLALTNGPVPSEQGRSRPAKDGANPYNRVGSQAKPGPGKLLAVEPAEADSFNPYNSGQLEPEKRKKSWDDVHIDVSDRTGP